MKLHAITRAAVAPDTPARCDRALLAAVKAGSVDAMAALYDGHHQRVRVLARRLLGDDAAAEDVVQEVYAALPRAAGRYRGDADAQAFLLGITVKRARSHLRAAIRRRRLLESYARHERPGPRNPEQDAYREQLVRRLLWALDRISLAHREAFVLCEVEGIKAAEAAAILGIPEATVRTRLFHGRARLRALMADEVDS
jgi:RNA polymerase sigma-70 factor (ECF subfamily)